MDDIATVLYTEEQIQHRVRELGEEVTQAYTGRSPVLISVLKGGVMFLADLTRAIDLQLRVDFMSISRYGGSSSGIVRVLKDLDQDAASTAPTDSSWATAWTMVSGTAACRSSSRSRTRRSSRRTRTPWWASWGPTPRARPDTEPPADRVSARGRRSCRTPRRWVDWGEAMIELNLVGVRVELPSNQPIVLLKEREGERYLPIWIGAMEATAIAFALQGIQTQRPMTHDLLKNVLEEIQVQVERIVITELKDGTFYAVIVMSRNGTKYEVSSRPSDAIALAVRVNVPIFAQEEVLTEASIVIRDDEEQEVEKFREFLEQVTPEDFETKPEDFA